MNYLNDSNNIHQTVALDENDVIQKAEDANKLGNYFCPSCKSKMVLRRGDVRIAHFAHKSSVSNCNPETVLHKLGKEKVKEVLENDITNRLSKKASYICDRCYSVHEYDILAEVISLELERPLDKFRPDVSLIDKINNTRVVIEIVVTHPPEQDLLNFYNENNILYLRIDLKDFSDLDKIEEKLKYIKNGNSIDYEKIYSEKVDCIETEPEEEISQLFIIDFVCDNCNKVTKVALINADNPNPFDRVDPEDFTSEQLDLARKAGANIARHKFSTNGAYYLVNKCSHCQRLPLEASRGMVKQIYGDEYLERNANTQIIDCSSEV